MKNTLLALFLIGLCILCRAVNADGAPQAIQPSDVAADRVTFYKVGLVCPAAPKIGCGTFSKPLLRALTADSRIDGAWLNEAGTRLAIAWKGSRKPVRAEELNPQLEELGLAASDASHAELYPSFHANKGWFDAGTVDRLSEREAKIIAARFVKRLSDRVAMPAEQRAALLQSIERRFLDRFMDGRIDKMEDALAAAAKDARLDHSTTAQLRAVAALGYSPLANEE